MTEERAVQSFPVGKVLGVPISLLDMAGTVKLLESYVAEGGPHMLVTADASGFAIASEDEELRRIYLQADVLTPDSQGVVWALRKAGCQATCRVSGVDLVGEICALSANKGYRIFLLGASPGVAEMAAEKLRLKHPGCNIVGTRHGFFPSEDDVLVAQEVAPFQPDFLFVAMGIPRQEKFIAKTRDVIGAKVAIGVGGSFDVFSGKAKRAPVIVQKLKMEWLWRLLLNPSKFSKVKMLPKFVKLVMRDRG